MGIFFRHLALRFENHVIILSSESPVSLEMFSLAGPSGYVDARNDVSRMSSCSAENDVRLRRAAEESFVVVGDVEELSPSSSDDDLLHSSGNWKKMTIFMGKL